jgi:hypothetical protein
MLVDATWYLAATTSGNRSTMWWRRRSTKDSSNLTFSTKAQSQLWAFRFTATRAHLTFRKKHMNLPIVQANVPVSTRQTTPQYEQSEPDHYVSERTAPGGWLVRDKSPYNMKSGESIVTYLMFFMITRMFNSETILLQE